MESEGYKVRWETSRRNITYTTPSGWQCRDRLLFGDKYLNERTGWEQSEKRFSLPGIRLPRPSLPYIP